MRSAAADFVGLGQYDWWTAGTAVTGTSSRTALLPAESMIVFLEKVLLDQRRASRRVATPTKSAARLEPRERAR
jgi:hypothetical protein